jgi:type II secretory pathway pseudopilin PulG
MRLKKSMPAKKSARARKSRFTDKMAVRTMVLVVIGVMGAAVLIGARQSSQPTDAAAVNARVENVAATQAQAKMAGSSTWPATGVVAATFAADTTDPNLSGVEAPKAAPVTLSGCLEQTDETFRLKDTTGADAPKARSWKSGFLKKGSTSIALVNAPKKLKLPEHVGQRVSVTGMLVDREMQVRSMQRVSATCS